MIRYYYTKLQLFFTVWRALRNERKGRNLRSKITKLETVISAGFTNEKEFELFNKKLIENRKRQLDPTQEKQLEEFRHKHYNGWKPKRHFKDSKNRHAQHEAQKRNEFVRVLKNRPLVKNPQDSQPDQIPDKIPTPEVKGNTNG